MGVNISGGTLSFDAIISGSQFSAQIRQMEADLRHLTQTTQQQNQQVEGLVRKTGAAMAGFLSLAAGKAFIQQLIDVRSQFQGLQFAFETMLGSKEKADKLFAEAVQLAAKTPFELADVGAAAKQLLAYGTAAQDITKTIRMLGDVAAGVGAPLNDIIYLYGTLQTSGRVYWRDIIQFAGRGIPIMRELADVMGINQAHLKQFVEEGKVGFEDVQKAFEKMAGSGGMFFNMMEKQSQTLNGKISNLKDAWSRMLNDIGQGNQNIFAGAIEGATQLVDNYEKVIDILEAIIAAYGTYKAVIIAVNTYQEIQNALQAASVASTTANTTATAANAAAQSLAAGATFTFSNAIKALTLSMKANPAMWLATAVGALILIFKRLSKETDVMTQAMSGYNEELRKEQDTLKELVTTAQAAAVGTKERADAIASINQKYGSYLKNLLTETASNKDLADSYELINTKLRDSIALKYRDKTLEKGNKEFDQTKDEIFGSIIDKVRQKKGPEAAGQAIVELSKVKTQLLQLYDEIDKASAAGNRKLKESLTRQVIDIQHTFNKQFDLKNNFNIFGRGGKIEGALGELVQTEQTQKKFNAEINKMFGVVVDSVKEGEAKAEKTLDDYLKEKNLNSVFDKAFPLAQGKTALESVQKKLLEEQGALNQNAKDFQAQFDAIQTNLNKVDAALEKFNNKKKGQQAKAADTAAAKAADEYNDMLRDRQALLEKISDMQLGAARTGMQTEQSEISKTRQKYDDLFRAIKAYNDQVDKYNATHKKKIDKVGQVVIDSVNSAENYEISNIQQKEDAKRYADHLDTLKGMFERYEDAKAQYGVKKAEEMYRSQLGDASSFIEQLREDMQPVMFRVMLGVADTGTVERFKTLLKQIGDENKRINEERWKDELDLFEKTMTLAQKEQLLRQQHAKDLALLREVENRKGLQASESLLKVNYDKQLQDARAYWGEQQRLAKETYERERAEALKTQTGSELFARLKDLKDYYDQRMGVITDALAKEEAEAKQSNEHLHKLLQDALKNPADLSAREKLLQAYLDRQTELVTRAATREKERVIGLYRAQIEEAKKTTADPLSLKVTVEGLEQSLDSALKMVDKNFTAQVGMARAMRDQMKDILSDAFANPESLQQTTANLKTALDNQLGVIDQYQKDEKAKITKLLNDGLNQARLTIVDPQQLAKEEQRLVASAQEQSKAVDDFIANWKAQLQDAYEKVRVILGTIFDTPAAKEKLAKAMDVSGVLDKEVAQIKKFYDDQERMAQAHYQKERAQIEATYTGEEKESRLRELEGFYQKRTDIIHQGVERETRLVQEASDKLAQALNAVYEDPKEFSKREQLLTAFLNRQQVLNNSAAERQREEAISVYTRQVDDLKQATKDPIVLKITTEGMDKELKGELDAIEDFKKLSADLMGDAAKDMKAALKAVFEDPSSLKVQEKNLNDSLSRQLKRIDEFAQQRKAAIQSDADAVIVQLKYAITNPDALKQATDAVRKHAEEQSALVDKSAKEQKEKMTKAYEAIKQVLATVFADPEQYQQMLDKLNEIFGDSMGELKQTALQSSEAMKAAMLDTFTASRQEMVKAVKVMEQTVRAGGITDKRTGKFEFLTFEQLEYLREAIARIKEIERLSHSVGGMMVGEWRKFARGIRESAGYLTQLAGEIKNVNKALGEQLELGAAAVDGLGSALQLATSLYTGDVKGAVDGIIGIVSSITKLTSRNREQERQFHKEQQQQQFNIYKGELEINKLYFDRRMTAIQIGNEQYAAIKKQLDALKGRSKEIAQEIEDTFKKLDNQLRKPMNDAERQALSRYQALGGTPPADLMLKGKSLDELEKLLKQDLLGDEAKKWVELLLDLRDQGLDVDNMRRELEQQGKELITGTSASSIADSIAQGFAQGKRSAQDFAGDFHELMKQAVVQALRYKVLEKPIQELFDKFAQAADDADGLTQGEIQQLQEQYNTILSMADQAFQQMQQVTGIAFGAATQAGNNSQFKEALRGMTEDTAELIAGQFGGMRLTMIDVLKVCQQQFATMQLIERNTATMVTQMAIMINKFNDYETGARKLSVK